MTRLVLDASAVTAVLRREPGYENVLPHLRGSLISSVNLAEVFCVSRARGSQPEMDELAIPRMQLERVPFDDEQAKTVASIYPKTLGNSVGLADRVCMALGLLHGLPVLTGDHDWLQHDTGVEIRVFREKSRR